MLKETLDGTWPERRKGLFSGEYMGRRSLNWDVRSLVKKELPTISPVLTSLEISAISMQCQVQRGDHHLQGHLHVWDCATGLQCPSGGPRACPAILRVIQQQYWGSTSVYAPAFLPTDLGVSRSPIRSCSLVEGAIIQSTIGSTRGAGSGSVIIQSAVGSN